MKERNERNGAGAVPMERRPLMVLRKDLDTKRRRDTNQSYRQTLQTPRSGTWQNSKNYRTPQLTILLAKDKRKHQTIHKEL